ncbi:MAG: hypothetical protein AAGE59_19375 [Cyanobacteria bacterium P01_F01_bin.86]
MANQNYRLIWFQHFHKAGGTSVINLAQKNGETFYPKHRNGNPVNKRDKLMKFGEYSEERLRAFIDKCEQQGITLISTEWQLPKIDVLASDSRVILVTCLRHPLKRFVSNFYYDLYLGTTKARKLEDYAGSKKGEYAMFNYYSRILSRHNRDPQDLTDKQFSQAIQALQKFDCCLILENGFEALRQCLGWQFTHMHANHSPAWFSPRHIAHLIQRKRYQAIFLGMLHPKRQPSQEFVEEFNTKNHWDLRLYAETLKQYSGLS